MFWKIFRKETVAAELSGVHLGVLGGRLTWVLSQDTGHLRLLGPCADPVGQGGGRALGVVGESSGGWCGRNP